MAGNERHAWLHAKQTAQREGTTVEALLEAGLRAVLIRDAIYGTRKV